MPPAVPTAPPQLVVASFNVHAGVDGWGRPVDLVTPCHSFGADVVVLQELWAPDHDPDQPAAMARQLGYELSWHPMASGRRALPHPRASSGWLRPGDWRANQNAIYLDSELPLPARITRSERFREAEPGSWGVGVLTRTPVERTVIDLGRLPRDAARRLAVVVRLDLGGRQVAVVGTHMSHLTKGSPTQFRRLQRALEGELGATPAVLVGDMNLWGPGVSYFLKGWRRVLRGRTWPSWRPHSQLDHVLVRGDLHAVRAEVLPDAGSDHRPVRARLALGDGGDPASGPGPLG